MAGLIVWTDTAGLIKFTMTLAFMRHRTMDKCKVTRILLMSMRSWAIIKSVWTSPMLRHCIKPLLCTMFQAIVRPVRSITKCHLLAFHDILPGCDTLWLTHREIRPWHCCSTTPQVSKFIIQDTPEVCLCNLDSFLGVRSTHLQAQQ